MEKYDCYREGIKAEPRYSQYTGASVGSVDVKFAYCTGTRELDECSGGGDRTKCDFYPEIRKKTRTAAKTVSGIPISRNYLSNWYIYSVDDPNLIWAKRHLDKHFYLIPKEK